MRLWATGLALIALIGSTACTATQPRPSTPATTLQAELDSLRAQYGFPGATAAIVRADGTVETAATGWADIEDSLSMTPDSRMLAASIGKTFVGATTLALAREGVLDLDAPVSRWLGGHPWFPGLAKGATITLRQLLTHSSGLEDHVYTDAFRQAFREEWRIFPSPFGPERLIAFLQDRPLLFEPGAGWSYSDTGYLLVGLVIEAATGESYYDTVSRLFLEPLALGRTSPSDRRKLPGLAAGYMAADNPFGLPVKTTVRPGEMAWDPAVEGTGGGLVSTSRDLATWAHALYGGLAMPGDYTEALLASVPLGEEAPHIRYGLAVAIHEKGPLGPTYGHAGWIMGYTSSLRYYADQKVAVAFQINTDVGIIDGTTELVNEAELRLARVALEAGGIAAE